MRVIKSAYAGLAILLVSISMIVAMHVVPAHGRKIIDEVRPARAETRGTEYADTLSLKRGDRVKIVVNGDIVEDFKIENDFATATYKIQIEARN